MFPLASNTVRSEMAAASRESCRLGAQESGAKSLVLRLRKVTPSYHSEWGAVSYPK